MKFRSRPQEIEAVLWDGSNDAEVEAFIGRRSLNSWRRSNLVPPNGLYAELWVNKIMDWIILTAPQWIVKELDYTGFYPCDPDTFSERWEQIT